jgi:hypothetical protein
VVNGLVRIFDRNMFIMLLSIMIGAIIITYFVADIARRSEIESYQELIQDITTEKNVFENKSKNFTDHIFKSLGSLDFSREYRSSADSYYDVAALIWYPNGEYEKVVVNCTSAMEDYLLGYENFLNTKSFFNDTIQYSTDVKYTSIINIYKKLSQSGANICLLGYNASKLLKELAENFSLYGNNTNVSALLELYNESLLLLEQGLGFYMDLLDELEEEYETYFNPVRETP